MKLHKLRKDAALREMVWAVGERDVMSSVMPRVCKLPHTINEFSSC